MQRSEEIVTKSGIVIFSVTIIIIIIIIKILQKLQQRGEAQDIVMCQSCKTDGPGSPQYLADSLHINLPHEQCHGCFLQSLNPTTDICVVAAAA